VSQIESRTVDITSRAVFQKIKLFRNGNESKHNLRCLFCFIFNFYEMEIKLLQLQYNRRDDIINIYYILAQIYEIYRNVFPGCICVTVDPYTYIIYYIISYTYIMYGRKKWHSTCRCTPTFRKYCMASYESRKTIHYVWHRSYPVPTAAANAIACVYQIILYTTPLQGDGFLPQSFSRPSPSPRFIMIITTPRGATYIMCLYKLLFATRWFIPRVGAM